MSARVREEVQQDEIVGSAMQDQILLILIFLGFLAKDTGGRGFGGTDVSVPPRAPEMIHP